jgi:ribonuclease BN (tRNA processing enzyme)
MRKKLEKYGFTITEEGKHYRLTYHGDHRYSTTIAKTGSDNREGMNIATEILRDMM